MDSTMPNASRRGKGSPFLCSTEDLFGVGPKTYDGAIVKRLVKRAARAMSEAVIHYARAGIIARAESAAGLGVGLD